jgi:hypothetical protein
MSRLTKKRALRHKPLINRLAQERGLLAEYHGIRSNRVRNLSRQVTLAGPLVVRLCDPQRTSLCGMAALPPKLLYEAPTYEIAHIALKRNSLTLIAWATARER